MLGRKLLFLTFFFTPYMIAGNFSLASEICTNIQKLSSDTIKNKEQADSMWKNLAIKPPSSIAEITRPISSETFAEKEIRNRKFREKGLEFWNSYPNDERKFRWLFETISAGYFTYYWEAPNRGAEVFFKYGSSSSILVDENAVLKWNRIYPYLREEFMQSPLISRTRKNQFRECELLWIISTQINPLYRGNKKFDFLNYAKLYREYSEEYWEDWNSFNRNQYSNPNLCMQPLLNQTSSYGMDFNDLLQMTSYLNTTSKSSEILKWVAGVKKYVLLTSQPFKLSHTTIDGKDFNLDSLRGKVVLIDFWATWCSSCIRLMPIMKNIYDKYKSRGFEVVSVSLDFEEDKDEVLKVEHKIGADWPVIIIGGKKSERKNSLYSKIWTTYSFTSIPVVLVLNKSGLLIGDLGDFTDSERFENKLKKWLLE